MALEAVVFPQDHLFGGCSSLKELCGFEFGNLLLDFCDEDQGAVENLAFSPMPPTENVDGGERKKEEVVVVERKRRRRARSCKNEEEMENQRMTHIAVERNRRKLMNEYLAVLRSIMPPAYVQRGDQASIVGGAINFVKELEQLLQTLEAQRRIKHRPDSAENCLSSSSSSSSSPPFRDFFAFPQYSSSSSQTTNATATAANSSIETVAKNQSAIADIEVTMVESHANLKVLSKRRPKQLLKMVARLQSLRLPVLHLNVTTVEQMVLYSFSLKVEDGCQFKSVDDIAAAVHQIIEKIQEESQSESVCN